MVRAKLGLLFLFAQLPFYVFGFTNISPVIGSVPLNQNQNISTYFPKNLKNAPEVLISRNEYLISYNRQTRMLNWAAWKLEASDIGHVGRSNNFVPDQDLQNYLTQFNEQAVTPMDFKGSCFDRGHQVPSADRDTSVETNQMTFFMSNMIPQTARLNRSIWEHLESYTRDLVMNQGKKVYIIAGPIFDDDFGKIGPNNDIPVPSKDFKIVIVLDKDQTLNDIASAQIISVVMPNTLYTGEKPNANKDELCKEASPPPAPVKPPAPGTPPTTPPADPGTPAPVTAPVVATPVVTPPPVLPNPPPLTSFLESENLGVVPAQVITPPPVVAVPPPVATTPPTTPPSHPLNDDWKQYQVPLEQIENLSGFGFASDPTAAPLPPAPAPPAPAPAPAPPVPAPVPAPGQTP
ncbi:MAG: DNA/RNA non-specific endonuclease [Pseudobdellovibrio sp.]